jgi:hypothetical protein
VTCGQRRARALAGPKTSGLRANCKVMDESYQPGFDAATPRTYEITMIAVTSSELHLDQQLGPGHFVGFGCHRLAFADLVPSGYR